MKEIAIFCVTYNSYKELSTFISSVDKASNLVRGKANISIFIKDNTSENYQSITPQAKYCTCQVLADHTNNGYFGGVRELMKCVDMNKYDFSIISNIDLELDEHCFENLCNLNVKEDTGWIAPQIYSSFEKRDKNPRNLQRYSLTRLRIIKILYKFPLLNLLYTQTAYKRKRFQKHKDGIEIYAGHGSFIILTKEFYKRCGIINYPIFLFGEEIYLGETCLRVGLKVIYEPSIKILDSEHVSTKTLKKDFYNRCNLEAINYLIKNYY